MAKATMGTRNEIINRMKQKYRRLSKKEKGQILDHLCESTGLSRDRLKHLLVEPTRKPLTATRQRRRKREPKYGPEVVKSLERVWFYMDFACGRRLTAGMPEMLEALRRCGEIDFTDEMIRRLETMSASTADRLLKQAKTDTRLKGKSTTKPGTLLKRDIPIRLGTEWDGAIPGYVEIDLVAHCGDTTAGDYVNTLDVTDISTGWTETAAVLNKAQRHVFAALKDIGKRLPFPYKGIDSDNGSEFINAHLYRFCVRNNIVFTRSRPNRKNDNCHVEQKNWHVIRRNIGYARYEGKEAVRVLNDYYARLRLYSNFFLPQTKLISKTRDGARIRKQYDTPKTPYRRLLDSEHIGEAEKALLRETYESLNPARLKREMVMLLALLERVRKRLGNK